MTTPRPAARRFTALLAAAAATLVVTGTVTAHPESEGPHPSGCIVTAEPGTVPPGGQFTVSGNFGGASIWVLPGANASPGEGQAPDATTPQGASSFSVTFTASQTPGELTVVAALPESECGDTDHITVGGTLPNTAIETRSDAAILGGVVLLLAAGAAALAAIGAHRFGTIRR